MENENLRIALRNLKINLGITYTFMAKNIGLSIQLLHKFINAECNLSDGNIDKINKWLQNLKTYVNV